MNIFVLDQDPVIAAQYHCDKHVVKMILESCQLLCTAHRVVDNTSRLLNTDLYKATHINHPCSRWVRETLANYLWTYSLFLGLCAEYRKRYDRIHSCHTLYTMALSVPPSLSGERTEFVQAMPEQYKDQDAVKAYRNYYIGEKSKFAKWKTQTPSWFIHYDTA